MSFDEQLNAIAEERKVLGNTLEPLYKKLYELQEKEKEILREKELASGLLKKSEEFEFRRAMGIFGEIMKSANTSSISYDDKAAQDKKTFDFEMSSSYRIHNGAPHVSLHLTVISKIQAVFTLLEKMIKQLSLTGSYWSFDKYMPLELEGTFTEEEYTMAIEELDE